VVAYCDKTQNHNYYNNSPPDGLHTGVLVPVATYYDDSSDPISSCLSSCYRGCSAIAEIDFAQPVYASTAFISRNMNYDSTVNFWYWSGSAWVNWNGASAVSSQFFAVTAVQNMFDSLGPFTFEVGVDGSYPQTMPSLLPTKITLPASKEFTLSVPQVMGGLNVVGATYVSEDLPSGYSMTND
jgi:hypothetical protein